jgi:hypothetical protein
MPTGGEEFERISLPQGVIFFTVSEIPGRLAFISYSTKDQRFVRKLVRDLTAGGVNVWFAEREVHPGDSLIEALSVGLAECTDLLLVLSESFVSSRWCRAELRTLLHKNIADGSKRIFPLTLHPLAQSIWSEVPFVLIEDTIRIDMSVREYKRSLGILISCLGGVNPQTTAPSRPSVHSENTGGRLVP